jgi:hypothetical protein
VGRATDWSIHFFPLQFHNHLQHDIDVLSLAPTKNAEEKLVTVLKPDQLFQVSIDIAQSHTFSIRPSEFGYKNSYVGVV